MRHIFILFMISLLSFSFIMNEAHAKRFGGGRSFGVQRSVSHFSKPKPNSFKQPNASTQKSKWGGLLGGLLLGGLLTSLFMGHGLGSGLLSWLIVGGLIWFVVSLLRKRAQPSYQAAPAGSRSPFATDYKSSFETIFGQKQNDFSSSQTNQYPLGFVEADFLRDAKTKFIRLQAAYDQKNLADIKEFTAPEVLGEIQMQLQERGNEDNHTEVVSLDAELLDIANEGMMTTASVRFSGLIKENSDQAESFNEIWHFRKYQQTTQWVVSGVQQGLN